MPAPTFDKLLLFSFCLVKTMKIKTSCILNENFKRLFFLLIFKVSSFSDPKWQIYWCFSWQFSVGKKNLEIAQLVQFWLSVSYADQVLQGLQMP